MALKYRVIIPVYNPDNKFIELLKSIKSQTMKNVSILIIDSGDSETFYHEQLIGMNAEVKKIDALTFNHGGTRQKAMEKSFDVDIFIFFTQDAILANSTALENIINVFDNPIVGCAFGRQLPHKDANVLSAHARFFNYPSQSYVRSFESKAKYGLKTVFISNSFAAYRYVAVKDVGGFPTDTILSEDMYLAAKMILKKWNIAYVAEAKVYHSHNYNIIQEFKRYFDIGVFQSREKWIEKTFGKAKGEGCKFVLSELEMIIRNKYFFILFDMMLRNTMKILGYILGKNEKKMPFFIKRNISMNYRYWE